MCGIAGAVDLRGSREFPRERILAMTRAIAHRGPDDEQVFIEPGVALGNRRLAIIDVAAGRQPMCNEARDVWVAYEGEVFNYDDVRGRLLANGHHLRTMCDTETWVHLYEDHGDACWQQVEGQFAVSIWDSARRTLLLGRDRVGICPLFYAEADGWLIWSSEIKGLLASGMIDVDPDPRAIDFFFNFFALPQERTCFRGVRSLPPGYYLKIRNGSVNKQQYWDLDYPDAGDERRFPSESDAVDEYEALLRSAVRRRLIGERPICCYISGGLDSTAILGLSCEEFGHPLPSLTVGLSESGPNDERRQAAESAGLLNSPLTTVAMSSRDIADAYPELVRGAEGPVLDTSAGCMVRLAQAAQRQNFVVALTGEGSDEALAGYVWFKAHQIVRKTGGNHQQWLRALLLSRLGGARHRPAWQAMGGVRIAQQFSYEMMAQSRELVFSESMWDSLAGYDPYGDLPLPGDRMHDWHPLNQSLYAAYKIMLPGMLLAAKGDRALKNASMEGRYPFLDERVVDFCCRLPPRFKLRGFTDKWLLRQLARKALPKQISNRPKTMFRAHLATTFLSESRPPWVDDLLSEESLLCSGFFDPVAVARAVRLQQRLPRRSLRRLIIEMGLTAVVSTQLWYHEFFGGRLCALPNWEAPRLKKDLKTPAVDLAMER